MAKTKVNKNVQKARRDEEDEQLRRYEIYNQLLKEEISNMPAKLFELFNESQDSYKLSLLVFITKLTGLGNVGKDISLVNIKQSLGDILMKLEQTPKQLSQMHLVDSTLDGHRLFSSNFNELISEGLLTDEYKIVSTAPVLQWFIDWLSILSNSRLRVVRNSAIEIAHRLIVRCKQFYQNKNSSAKRALKNFMIGMSEILRSRLSDIDKNIRIKACDIIFLIYQSLQNDILTKGELKNTFGGMINDKREDISSLGLKYTSKLFQMKDSAVLLQFGNQILPRIYSICLKHKALVNLSVDLLITMKRYSNMIEIELDSIVSLISKLSRNQASNLKIMVELFYIISFESYLKNQDKKKARAQINPKEVISQIIALFSKNIDDLGSKIKLFQKFIEFDISLFPIELLFEFLYTQEIVGPSSSSRAKMNKDELRSHLILMHAYSLIMRDNIQIDFFERQKKLEEFSIKLLKSGEQIFCDQIKESPILAEDFIRLFTVLHKRMDKSDYYKQIQLIFEEIQKIFTSNGSDSKLLYVILQALQQIYPDGIKIMLQNLNFDKFYKADEQQLNKVSVISNFIDITERFHVNTLHELMPMLFSKNEKIQAYILNILHHSHVLKMKGLFKQIDEHSLEIYLEYRNTFITFLLNILKKQQVTKPIKQLTFKYICQTLTLVMHTKISELEILFYALSDDTINSMFLFLYQAIIGNGQSPEYSLDEFFDKIDQISEQDITIDKIGLLKLIVNLSTRTIRFGINPLSIKLLLTLLKSKKFKDMVKEGISDLVKQEILEENTDKFVYWTLFRALVFSPYFKNQIQRKQVLQDLLSVYLNIPNWKSNSKNYTRKMIIFFAECVDDSFKNNKLDDFEILNSFFSRTQRRFTRQTISRLAGLTKHKIDINSEANQNQHCVKLNGRLMKIAIRNNKRMKDNHKKNKRQEQNSQKSSASSSKSSASKSKSVSKQRSSSNSSKASSSQRSSSSSSNQSVDSASKRTSPDISLRPRRLASSRPTMSKQRTKDKQTHVVPRRKAK